MYRYYGGLLLNVLQLNTHIRIQNAMETPCCGTTYCGKCLAVWLEDNRGNCPNCRCAINENRCKPNRAIQVSDY